MRNSKYAQQFRIGRFLPWVLIAVVALSAIAGAVVAYLSYATGGVENTFTPAQNANPTVMETFEDNTKSNVYVNVGTPGYSVYVRAAVVITWKSDIDGNVLGRVPVAGEGEEYTIAYNATDWFQGADGFWYYKYAVESGSNTAPLIHTCAPVPEKNPVGYKLNVEIIAQTIQALGETDDGTQTAVENAWGVSLPQS